MDYPYFKCGLFWPAAHDFIILKHKSKAVVKVVYTIVKICSRSKTTKNLIRRLQKIFICI